MLPLLISLTATDPVPTDDSVKAGWTAFVVFLLLGLAIVFLGWSFTRQMKKVKKADEQGLYGRSETVESPEADSPEHVDHGNA